MKPIHNFGLEGRANSKIGHRALRCVTGLKGSNAWITRGDFPTASTVVVATHEHRNVEMPDPWFGVREFTRMFNGRETLAASDAVRQLSKAQIWE